MRIIAGSAKKRLLKVHPGWKGRPTADRIKESLFNILGNLVVDSNFLDLFAGTGSIGIEALSRGACGAVFIEKDPRAAGTIIENLKNCGLETGSRVIAGDVHRVLESIAGKKGKSFDIVFLDPPYDRGFEAPVIRKVLELGLLAPGGLVVAESSKRTGPPGEIMGLKLVRREKYGDTMISFYREVP